jgi:hypothetical protein
VAIGKTAADLEAGSAMPAVSVASRQQQNDSTFHEEGGQRNRPRADRRRAMMPFDLGVIELLLLALMAAAPVAIVVAVILVIVLATRRHPPTPGAPRPGP